MTDLIEQADVDGAGGASKGTEPPARPPGRSPMRRRSVLLAVACAVLLAGVLTTVAMNSGASTKPAARPISNLSLVSQLYKPQGSVGETDDYHCTLLNPHVTHSSFVISSQFTPGSPEVHHAVLSLVPPSMAATAMRDNAATGGTGWSCFGAPGLPGGSFAQFLSTPFLSVWAPGHGADTLPRGTGISLPAGSLVIMQVHYNLLVGDKPVSNSLVLDTVKSSTPLLTMHASYRVAPPDIPCPAGVTGPLCTRSASLADQAKRFGADQAETVNLIEAGCGHNPSNPPASDTASCTWPVGSKGYIVRVQPHMHLLGSGFSMILNPGTPQAKTVLSVPNYNFDYQKAYNLSTPIPVNAGDRVQINCTYNPKLAQQLPVLRKAPAHFVTWGDGSSDEMCVGVAWTTTKLPNPHAAL